VGIDLTQTPCEECARIFQGKEEAILRCLSKCVQPNSENDPNGVGAAAGNQIVSETNNKILIIAVIVIALIIILTIIYSL
jgi:hypothetical protein